jgi:hypothetical protein
MHPRIPLPPDFASRPFIYRDGLAAGWSDGRLRGPDLTTPFRGVRIVAGSTETTEGRCRAFMPLMPKDGFFNDLTSAELLGMPLPGMARRSLDIHAAVFSPRHPPRGKGVLGHAVRPMGGDIVRWRGMPLASAVRTWMELAAHLDLTHLVAAGDHVIHWRSPLATRAELEESIPRYPGRRGKPKLWAAVALLDERSESPMESGLRVILHLAGIQGLVANHPCGSAEITTASTWPSRNGRSLSSIRATFTATRSNGEAI